MQYRKDKYGQDLSILGFGCMRFTRKGNSIDFPKAEEEIMEAFRAGVNYYDTAYIYPGSEVLLGTVLQRNGIRKTGGTGDREPTSLPDGRLKFLNHHWNQPLFVLVFQLPVPDII